MKLEIHTPDETFHTDTDEVIIRRMVGTVWFDLPIPGDRVLIPATAVDRLVVDGVEFSFGDEFTPPPGDLRCAVCGRVHDRAVNCATKREES